jgi:hypothetical protein
VSVANVSAEARAYAESSAATYAKAGAVRDLDTLTEALALAYDAGRLEAEETTLHREIEARSVERSRLLATREPTGKQFTYEGRLVTATANAVLWFIPWNRGSSDNGQAAWIPRVVVVEAIDGSDPGPLGVLVTKEAIEWRCAHMVGKSVEFKGGHRRSA